MRDYCPASTGIRRHTVHSVQQMTITSRRLLTARQVQELLGIDRSTVYRMAGDGRLAAIRVGKQLRFPADQITDLLAGSDPAAEPALIDPVAARAAIRVAADLLGVSMVVTDMSGEPITEIANPCDWFKDTEDREEKLRACFAEWQQMAHDNNLSPRFRQGSVGFECARAFIRVGSSLVGMVVAGGIAPPESTSSDFHRLTAADRERVLTSLPVVAAIIGGQAASPSSLSRGLLSKENQ